MIVKSPNAIPESLEPPKIFLGGSIEMGKAENWQELTEKRFDSEAIILNPRRDDWDSSWIQDPTPGTQFHEQVTWELEAQKDADILVYYFADETQSPITLLELGLHAADIAPIVVRCTDKFWRYGNVKIVCDEHRIPVVSTIEEMFEVVDFYLK